MSSNPWNSFRRLIPQDRLGVGTSLGPNGDGTSNVQLVGGGEIRAEGNAPGGQQVFLKGTRITSDAPSYPLVTTNV